MVLAILLAAGELVAQQRADPHTLRVGAVRGTLLLDGRLDEPMWAAADSIAQLTQIEPTQGATASGRTVVRVIASTSR